VLTLPANPIEAVVHADPYPYYADLVAHAPVHRDETLGLWVASSARAVTAVLASGLCRVRPRAEPVPRALVGTAAGAIFGHLVRMNDGLGHRALKPAVARAIDTVSPPSVHELSARWARVLVHELALDDFTHQLSSHVIATLLGVPGALLRPVAHWTADLAGALGPRSTPEQIERGAFAAARLLDVFQAMSPVENDRTEPRLFAVLEREAQADGPAMSAIAANGIGLLTQAYEATAGLIGNAVVALAARPELRRDASRDLVLLRRCVEEVARHDAPVQNTRRFLASPGIVAGTAMQEGDAVLVLLAAANRDPAANPDPDRFDPTRAHRRTFTFGSGAHACPGQSIATAIAAAGVAALLSAAVDLERAAERATYRPSVNVRIPLFDRT
jgi:cytochrome P450